MDRDTHIAAVQRESEATTAALRRADLDAVVPTCPDWTLSTLTTHMGGFAWFWAEVLREATGRPSLERSRAPSGPEVVDWYRDLVDGLVAELRATPADQPVWTWVEDQRNAAFVARRAAHEYAVHRVDAELTGGSATPIDPELAVDGIEEIFVMIAAFAAGAEEELARRGRQVRPGTEDQGKGQGEMLHLHATDCDAEWTLRLTPDGLEVERAHSKGDLALRGPVSDLELILYNRPTVGDVDRFGDATVLDAWYRAFKFG